MVPALTQGLRLHRFSRSIFLVRGEENHSRMTTATRQPGPPHAQLGKVRRTLLSFASVLWTLLALAPPAHPQTLARPGWAGSGMTVERWWPHAVFCEISPESLASSASGSTLERVTSRMSDLQTLGIDGILLRGLEPATPAGGAATPGSVALDPRFGTLDNFDALVTEAVRHGIRVLVELRPGQSPALLTSEARLWLNHGVTGLALGSGDEAQIRAIRGVLHGYVGERILISAAPPPAAEAGPSSDAALLAQAQNAKASPQANPDHRENRPDRSDRPDHNPDRPDLILVRLPPVAQGPAAMRSAIQSARARIAAHGPVPLLSTSGPGDRAAARPLATALLGSGGAVLLNVDDLGLADPAAHTREPAIFAWYKQWNGLHRGNPIMRTGDDILLDHDAEGALVWVRKAATGGAAPVVAICNLTGSPIHLSLTDDIAHLRLRGSFLRTVARSDGGMGAMPLRAVTLPPFAVYVGELSR